MTKHSRIYNFNIARVPFVLINFVAILFVMGRVHATRFISVSSEFKKEVNVKIHGSGAGGCDVIIQPGQSLPQSCYCLGGTLNYSFCAYVASGLADFHGENATSSTALSEGKCPKVTGENLICSDLTSLGNCYDASGYTCLIDVNGLCHCQGL